MAGKRFVKQRQTHKTVTAIGAALGATPVQTRAITKGINALSVAKRVRAKRKARKVQDRKLNTASIVKASLPAASGIVMEAEPRYYELYPSRSEIITGASSGSAFFAGTCAPWYSSLDSGFNTNWDPGLRQRYPMYLAYRIKRAVLEYVGSASASTAGTVYFGSTYSPLAPRPDPQDYAFLDTHKSVPVWKTGESIDIVHDNDWHDIADSVVIDAPTTQVDKSMYLPNQFFVNLNIPTIGDASVRFVLHMDIEFRGRNPVYEVPIIIASRGANDSATDAYNNAVIVASGGNKDAFYLNTTDRITCKAGYVWASVLAIEPGTTATTAGSASINLLDSAGNSVIATQCVARLTLGDNQNALANYVLAGTTTASVQVCGGGAIGLFKTNPGDQLSYTQTLDSSAGTQAVPTQYMFAAVRVDSARALQLYKLFVTTATSLPF